MITIDYLYYNDTPIYFVRLSYWNGECDPLSNLAVNVKSILRSKKIKVFIINVRNTKIFKYSS